MSAKADVVEERGVATAPSESVPESARRRVFSGMQPSGTPHIGNYLGAIKHWVAQQVFYDNVFCIVDLHALSLPTDPAALRQNTIGLATALLAAGIDPNQSIVFVQSDVREHAELCWLLNSVTQFGELRRMTQFKDKAGGQDEAVSAALFDYPVLQAADILLYDTELVPVGDDQRQHVELTRDIATRFNARYGETFVVPKADIKPEGARIMALDDPTAKMSKSAASQNGVISLTDDADTIRRKIRRSVTDSGSDVVSGPGKPALTNLLTIYALLGDDTVSALEERYAGKGYGAFKSDLGEAVVAALAPIQRRLGELQSEPEHVATVLATGADRARTRASAKMAQVRDRMGLGLGT
ncbi:MAG: Tryptophanyl-tRNA synthetase [uncultured Thermomicrobiales bacterium]|uniref:Tryptophan--tRNA ligase n=1 Tax=uncultured Thermomicrobiales bacterium TaxID=1645740 RepID=A0A6J4U6D5_9BACT|nr:MAG: Tryptophanyl-tRNA synthetase [uncultured Thermomicrobiales bacterium]